MHAARWECRPSSCYSSTCCVFGSAAARHAAIASLAAPVRHLALPANMDFSTALGHFLLLLLLLLVHRVHASIWLHRRTCARGQQRTWPKVCCTRRTTNLKNIRSMYRDLFGPSAVLRSDLKTTRTVGVDSSAARIPLPRVASACAVEAKASFCSSLNGGRS